MCRIKKEDPCEVFLIAEEISPKLKKEFPGNKIFQRALPQDIGIIGQFYEKCKKDRILRRLLKKAYSRPKNNAVASNQI